MAFLSKSTRSGSDSSNPSELPDLVKDTRDAMLSYYRLLAKMPHIEPDALQVPPPEGWHDVGDEKLRKRGKTEQAIDFIRHLPCLVHKGRRSGQRPYICPASLAVYFGQGEAIEEWVEDLLPTPAHVIWIGDAHSRNGNYLLLDTECSTITEWCPVGGILTHISYEDFEALSPSEKWMASDTLPATAWFQREYQRIQKLAYMPMPRRPFRNRGTKFWYRVGSPAEEQDLLSGDAEGSDYLSSDDDEDDFNSSSNSGSDEETDGLSQGELENLDKDDEVPDGFTPAATPVSNQEAMPSQNGSFGDTPDPEKSAIYSIYRDCGWPSEEFRRQECRDRLIQWDEETWEVERPLREAEEKARAEQKLADRKRREIIKSGRAAAANE